MPRLSVVTMPRADTASTLMSAYTTTHHDKWQSYQRWKKLHAETCAISVENESTLKKCFNVGRRFQRWEHSTLQQFFNAANCLIAKLFSTLKHMLDVGKTFQHWNDFKLQNYVQRWTRTLGFQMFLHLKPSSCSRTTLRQRMKLKEQSPTRKTGVRCNLQVRIISVVTEQILQICSPSLSLNGDESTHYVHKFL